MTTLPDLDPAPREPVVPAPRVFMIDNYDSFTYNLVQFLGALGATLRVVRNDRIRLAELAALAPSRLVLSPGPGRPEAAGISLEAVRRGGDQH
jgi:anthranilate/para-aminobenzoate synthase component II